MHDDFTVVSLSHATTIATGIAQCCVVYETGVHYRQVPPPALSHCAKTAVQ
jgi:hypothetical protein